MPTSGEKFVKEAVGTGAVNRGSPRGWLRFALRLPIFLYRLKLGWLLGRRFLLLTHTGRKSGKVHSTVLEILRYDPASHCCVIASGWGTNSQWYKNVLSNPRIQYTVGLRKRAGRAEQLSHEAAAQQLEDYGDRHPTAIRKLTKFLIGEEFEGSLSQYQRLAAQVPLLRLTPGTEGGDVARQGT